MQLQQVLVNLLDNAAKFSPPESPIGLAAALVGDELEVRVCNQGEGIPAGELERVFDRFYRVEAGRFPTVPGTGLGLAICKGIIEAHGGSIVARSVPGTETTILFRIPAADAAHDAPQPVGAQAALRGTS
jgi:two-component system sensor histidine kinase KdpD